MDTLYGTAAEKYRPEETCVVFVAEAPPNSLDRYFYFETVKVRDWLWIALMKALYPAEWNPLNAPCRPEKYTQMQRLRKKEWLRKFKDDRFQLIDAVKTPISGSDRKKVEQIRSGAGRLIEEIRQMRTTAPPQIVLIKETVHEALYQILSEAGLLAINSEYLPFPCSGQQIRFHNQLRNLVEEGKLKLGPC